jgi:hypothetical protein
MIDPIAESFVTGPVNSLRARMDGLGDRRQRLTTLVIALLLLDLPSDADRAAVLSEFVKPYFKVRPRRGVH